MPSNFEIVGVEAIVAGIGAFNRDVNNVNKLLADLNKTTSKLASDSAISWATVERTSNVAMSAIVSGASLAVIALTGITAATVKIGASFEANVLRASVATGATAKGYQQLQDIVLKVAKGTAIGITEIANAENTLARSGISLQLINDGVLKSTVSLSEASGGELGLEGAAKLVSIAINAWKLNADGARVATEALTAVANSSAVGFGDLSTSIQLVAPEAAALGFSVSDVASVLGVMGDAGIKGTTAGTAYKTMLVNLQSPSKEAAALIDEYGVGLYDATGKARNMRSVIISMAEAFGVEAVATGKITEAKRDYALATIFGTRSVLGAIATSRGAAEEFDKFQNAILNTDVNKMADAMRDSLNPQMDRLRNNLQALVIQMAGPLDAALGASVKGINNMLQAMDPAIPKAFGDALFTVFSGKGLATTGDELQKVFGAELGNTITKLIGVILALRTAVTEQIVPAFAILFKALTDGTNATSNFRDFLQGVIITIEQVGHRIANIVVVLSDFVRQIRSSTDTSNLLTGVLKVLVALPLAAFGLILLRIAAGFILMSGQAILLSVAIYAIGDIVRRVGATWDGTLAGMVISLKQLPIELQAFLGVLAIVAGVVATRFAIQAIGFASLQLRLFGTTMRLLKDDIQTIITSFIRATIAIERFILSIQIQAAVRFQTVLTDMRASLANLIAPLERAIIQIYRTVSAFVALQIAALNSALVTARAWLSMQIAALTSSARQVLAFAALQLAWVRLQIIAAASAIKTAEAWVILSTAAILSSARTIAASALMSIVTVRNDELIFESLVRTVGGYVALAVGAVTNVGRVIAAHALMAVSNIRQDELILEGIARIVLGYIRLAIAAVANTARVVVANVTMSFSAEIAGRTTAQAILLVIIKYAELAFAAIVNAIKVAGAWVVMQVASLTGSGSIIKSIGLAILSFGLLSAAAIRTAVTVSAAFLIGIVGSVIAAAAAISAPVLIIIGILAAIAIGLGILYFAFRDTWDDIVRVSAAAVNQIGDFIAWWIRGLVEALNIVAGFIGNFVLGAGELLQRVGAISSEQFNKMVVDVKNWASNLASQVGPAIQKVGVAVNPYLSGAADIATKAFRLLFGTVEGGAYDSAAAVAAMNLSIANTIALMGYAQENHAGEYGPGYGQKGFGKGTPAPYVPPPFTAGGPSITSPTKERGPSDADKMKALVAQFERLLAILPGDTKALAEFLAKLETDTPGRLQGMVNALLSARGILEDINASYGRILVLNQSITQVQNDLNAAQGAQNAIDIRAKLAVLGLQAQLNALDTQEIEIKKRLLPIQQAIAALDRQIADLQKVNLDYQRQTIEIQIQMLPIKQAMAAVDRQIADIDKEIAAAQKEDVQNTLDTAVLVTASLPIRQQIADLETQINRIHDNRLTLLRRQSEILASQRVDALTHQLGDTQRQLDTAWKNMNVPQILALEAQKNSLADSIVTATDQLTSIQDQQKAQAEAEELAQITLKLKEDTLQQILNDYDDQLTILQNIRAQEDADAAVVVAGLNIKKQALEDINVASQAQLDLLQGQLDAVNNLIDAENLQHQLEINGLEQQKAALEALAAPMLAQLQAIDDQRAAIQLEIDAVNALAEQQKAQFDAQILNDSLELASLQGIRDSEQARFDALVAGFIDTITASGAFTQQEAIEVATRLGFGNDQINKIGEIARAYDTTLVAAVKVATQAIDDIPREITVHVKVVTDNLPSFATGGVVPGPVGKPQLVIAHGGEQFMGVGNKVPLFAQAAANRVTHNNASTVNNYNYELNPNYTQVQSPANLGMDLRALITMSRK